MMYMIPDMNVLPDVFTQESHWAKYMRGKERHTDDAEPPAGMAGIVAVKRPMKGWEWVTHNRLIDTSQSFRRERNELAGCDMMHVAPYGWVTGIMIENGMVRTTDRWTDGSKEGPTER